MPVPTALSSCTKNTKISFDYYDQTFSIHGDPFIYNVFIIQKTVSWFIFPIKWLASIWWNIAHKWLKITNANILWHGSTSAIFIWFIIEAVLSLFQNKITNVFFLSRDWFWKSVLKSLSNIFLQWRHILNKD